MASLFGGLRFYLAHTLSTQDKEELEQLIQQNGGIVSDSLVGATELVECDKLDARHPERISTVFIQDSVAFRALQDPSKYSGKIFTTKQQRRGTNQPGNMPYTEEEDARMLHFAEMRGWMSMTSMRVWRLAENECVTSHTAHSMREHFRKQLQLKTPNERRIIMAKTAAMIRARLLEQENEAKEEQEIQRTRASTSSTGFRDVATSERTTRSTSQQKAMISSTIETRLKEVQEEKFTRRTRSRKPMAPLRISQRRKEIESDSDTSESVDEGITSSPPTTAPQASTVTPTRPSPPTPATPVAQSTPAASTSSTTSVTPRDQSAGRQKRKRSTPSSSATVNQESSPSRQDSDAESVENKTSGENGIFFRSAWTELVRDHSKRRMLQRFFEPQAPASEPQATSTEPVVNDENGGGAPDVDRDEGENQSESQQRRAVEFQQATDEETDNIICQLQIDTHQDMPSVVHALYYCNGDVEMANTFLKGASPSGMWSPQDDLLLVNLVSEEVTDHPAVDAALARGDFTTMMIPRNSDAILKRVQFLR